MDILLTIAHNLSTCQIRGPVVRASPNEPGTSVGKKDSGDKDELRVDANSGAHMMDDWVAAAASAGPTRQGLALDSVLALAPCPGAT